MARKRSAKGTSQSKSKRPSKHISKVTGQSFKANLSGKSKYPTRGMSTLESLPAEIWSHIMDHIFKFGRNEICEPDGDIITPLHQIGGLNFASQSTKYRVQSYISRKYGNRKLNLLRLISRDPTPSSTLAFAVGIGLLIDQPLKRGTRFLPSQYATELTHVLTDTFINWKLECARVVGKPAAGHQSRAFKKLINGAECVIAAKCRTISDCVHPAWFLSESWKEIESMLMKKNLDWMVDMLARMINRRR
ncbi:hypothetical protein N7451_006955 [Penicillium sp. IBT 35674x]|nr:hypothetical protein N7451_006955 [Penicillium sp. IBT 35674x]